MTFCQVIESSVSKVLLCSVAFVWLTIGDLALAADWTRINEDIVFGSGKIEIDEFQRFRKVYDCRVREVVLEHLGGSVVGSMDIADQILKDEVSVRVVGACLSSCANYLFLAGKKKTIAPGGLVGFHGSPFAGTLLLPNWTSVFAKKAKGEGHSEVEVLHGIELRRELFNREERFFDQVGIDIRLLTNSIDGERSRRVYKCSQKSLYLFPTKAKLEAYGVKNLFGDQSWSLLHFYGEPCIDVIDASESKEVLEQTHWASKKSSSKITKTCLELKKDLEKNHKNADDERFVLGKVTEFTIESLDKAMAAFEAGSCP